jgi:hypothetical protein
MYTSKIFSLNLHCFLSFEHVVYIEGVLQSKYNVNSKRENSKIQ